MATSDHSAHSSMCTSTGTDRSSVSPLTNEPSRRGRSMTDSWTTSPSQSPRLFLVPPPGWDDVYSSFDHARRRNAICHGLPGAIPEAHRRAISVDNPEARSPSPLAPGDVSGCSVDLVAQGTDTQNGQQLAIAELPADSARGSVDQALDFDSDAEEDHSDLSDEGHWMNQGQQVVLEPSLTPPNEDATSNAPTSPKAKTKCEEPFEAHKAISQPTRLTIVDLITNLSTHDLQITGRQDCPCEVDRWYRQRRRENACCCLCHLGEGIEAAPSWRNRSYTHECEVYVEWVEQRAQYDYSMPCDCLYSDSDGDGEEGLGSSYDELCLDDVDSWSELSGGDGEAHDNDDDPKSDRSSKAGPSGTSGGRESSPNHQMPEANLPGAYGTEAKQAKAPRHDNTIMDQAATPCEIANGNADGNANKSETSSGILPAGQPQAQAQTQHQAHQAEEKIPMSDYVSAAPSDGRHAAEATGTDKVDPAALPAPAIPRHQRFINFISSCTAATVTVLSSTGKTVDDAVLESESQLRQWLIIRRREQRQAVQDAIKEAAVAKAIARGYSTIASLAEDETPTATASTNDELEGLSYLDDFFLWFLTLEVYMVLVFLVISIVEIILTLLVLAVVASLDALH